MRVKTLSIAVLPFAYFAIFVGGAQAHAANFSLFDYNVGNKVVPNCNLQKEYNYFMNQWMTNFAYHTAVSVWTFIGTGIAVLVIAFLCLLYHSLKVSSINPVKSLKSE